MRLKMKNFCSCLVPVLAFLGTSLGRPDNDQPSSTSASTHSDLPATVASILNNSKIDESVVEHILSTPNTSNKNVTEISDYDDDIKNEDWTWENTTEVDTRRIMYSLRARPGERPYMVYLQLTQASAKIHKYRGWLCGGVILAKSYVLTSAACTEDADKFYIISGTTKFVDSFDFKSDYCVCHHRRRVVWKCIPKNYKFDFQDSLKWAANDIAVVRVDRPFKFGETEKGCEFPTSPIWYNNISRELEKRNTKGFILGWGTGSNFREGVYRREDTFKKESDEEDGRRNNVNAKCLQEAKVTLMDTEACSKKWAQRFRTIICSYMVCTKDIMKRLSELCEKKYANCTSLPERRMEAILADNRTLDDNVQLDLGRHLRDPEGYSGRRLMLGGFCENDHGGPLIVRYHNEDRVIGVISACKIDPKTHSCHGPFLYTSTFVNRQFLSCAIHKQTEQNCRRVFRSGVTHEEWDVKWDKSDDDEEKAAVAAFEDPDKGKETKKDKEEEKKKD